MGVAALLHDLGLVRLPRNILKRQKSMPPAQQALYDSHPAQGIVMLEKSGVHDAEVLAIVRSHHTVLVQPPDDSKNVEKGFESSALVAIVDQYDELINGQAASQPMSSNQAMTQLYQRYRDQPHLLDRVSYLIRAIGVFPLYSVVALKSGEVGVVGAITPGKAHLPCPRPRHPVGWMARMKPRVALVFPRFRHPSGDRIVDGDHRQGHIAVLDRLEGILEGAAGQGLVAGIGLDAGDVGIGSRFALVGDLLAHGDFLSSRRTLSRSSGMSTVGIER